MYLNTSYIILGVVAFQFLDLVGRAFFPDGIGKLLNVGHSQKLYRGVPPISV